MTGIGAGARLGGVDVSRDRGVRVGPGKIVEFLSFRARKLVYYFYLGNSHPNWFRTMIFRPDAARG